MAFKEDYWKKKEERKALSAAKAVEKFNQFLGWCKTYFAPVEPEPIAPMGAKIFNQWKAPKAKHTRTRKERMKRRAAHKARMITFKAA